jgi:GT2 family glycosyltransferase
MTAKEHPFPFVSIIIPMYNASATLKGCLESLMALSYPADRLEILCVDGCSTDDSREVAEAYRVRVIDNPARGVVSGRNLGFAAAQGELIAFSDADCTFDTGWIRNAVRYFTDETVAGVTGPIALPLDQNTLGRCINGLFRLAATFAAGGHENEVEVCQPAKHLPTCNAVFRTAALQNVMPIPEHLIAGEDVAMSHQLQLLGYQLLSVPDVRVQHYKRSTLRGFAKQMRWYAVARGQLSRIWPELQHPLHRHVPKILLGMLLLIGAMLWVKPVVGLLVIGLGGLFLGFLGGVYTRRSGAFFWQPLVILTFLVTWTVGCIEESFWSRRKANDPTDSCEFRGLDDESKK